MTRTIPSPLRLLLNTSIIFILYSSRTLRNVLSITRVIKLCYLKEIIAGYSCSYVSCPLPVYWSSLQFAYHLNLRSWYIFRNIYSPSIINTCIDYSNQHICSSIGMHSFSHHYDFSVKESNQEICVSGRL